MAWCGRREETAVATGNERQGLERGPDGPKFSGVDRGTDQRRSIRSRRQTARSLPHPGPDNWQFPTFLSIDDALRQRGPAA
jgi:hypothetical protein